MDFIPEGRGVDSGTNIQNEVNKMSKENKLEIIVRVKSRLFPEKADYFANLYHMFVSGYFTYESVLSEVKNG